PHYRRSSTFLLAVNTQLSTLTLSFFQAAAPTEISTLSLHDALPICVDAFVELPPSGALVGLAKRMMREVDRHGITTPEDLAHHADRKSTRLNSSHVSISYAVFCLKKKTSKTIIKNRVQTTYINN